MVSSSREMSSGKSDYEVEVLFSGYSKVTDGGMLANCSCSLIKGRMNIIVDTMTPWDREKIIDGLARHNIKCEDIKYVVCTHGHSDHIGNNNLFLNATHIVGFCVSHKDTYYNHSFDEGEKYVIDEFIEVLPTPGHTLSDVSVIVKTKNNVVTALTGDLFENESDLKDDSIWLEAGSENPALQRENRKKILTIADYIVPGHGSVFKVPRGS